MKKLFVLGLFALVAGCPSGSRPDPTTPTPSVDGGVDGGNENDDKLGVPPATCASWCAHARALGCGAGRPTRAGATCESVCVNVQTGPAKWNLRCRVDAKTCAAADSCE
jgi:hypothetical protein